jgi:predicted phage terminase large subunit-like protein
MIVTDADRDPDLALLKAKMLGSLLYFIQIFFKLRTGRDFVISNPDGRESHHITVCRELTKVFNLKSKRLLINIAPGHGKSTFISYFIAWSFAHYPDCQFLYVSYSHELASKHTENIRSIMQLPEYNKFFGVSIRSDSAAKDNFKTIQGGSVKAFGSGGSITGQDAGLPHLDRFSGAVLIDDAHKPKDVHSESERESVISNYNETIKPRPRGPNVPIVGIGQMLHEQDLFSFLRNGSDGSRWTKVILKTEDDCGNILDPALTPREMVEQEKKYNPYVWAAQHQQDPQPAGGGIFKPEWFVHVADEPNMLVTYITVDTAETDKTYNDATVFSFWGLYEIRSENRGTGVYGLHWIDCVSLHVEPAELEIEFRSFYANCCQYKVKPTFAAIEKKSTGVTLISVLESYRGLDIRPIYRTKASGSKIARYFEMQPYIAKKLISFNKYAYHADMCIEQARKITANNTHAHDDIIDTLYDAIRIGLIDESLIMRYKVSNNTDVVKSIADHFKNINSIRQQTWQI